MPRLPMLIGQCYVCGKPAMLACPMCGRTVCRDDLDADGRLCRPCRKRMARQAMSEEE